MSDLNLLTALRTHGHTAALKHGEVPVKGAHLDFIEVNPQILAFRRMVREVAYDVCELAPTTYIIAKAYGAPYTAIPVFFERRFHHKGLLVRDESGIVTPKDLEGKKVGVRAYTVTTGVWTRGVLVNEYGVDSSKVTWVVDDEEHVEQMPLPPNVEHVPEGKSLASMMRSGEIQAGFGANAGIGREGKPGEGWNNVKAETEAPPYHELFPDADELGAAWFRRTGIYPMHSTLVIKDEILKANPWLAQSLFDAFQESKEIYLRKVESGEATGKTDLRFKKQSAVVGDPLPYGYDVNKTSIEALILYAFQQGLIPRMMSVDELFLNVNP